MTTLKKNILIISADEEVISETRPYFFLFVHFNYKEISVNYGKSPDLKDMSHIL